MSISRIFSFGNIAKKTLEGMLSTGAVVTANYKLGEYDIDGITVVSLDPIKGTAKLQLDGESRDMEIIISCLVYSKETMGIKIDTLEVVIMEEGTHIRKKWIEGIVNNGIKTYIEMNDGMWINAHTGKILKVLELANYSTKK